MTTQIESARPKLDFDREMHLQALLRVQTFRAERHLGPLPAYLQAQLDDLLKEVEAAKQYAEANNQRQQLLLALLRAHEARLKACRELGLTMPPLPEGWADMLAECPEVVSLAAGRVPYTITVKLPVATPIGLACGALLIMRFDHRKGPIDCALIDIDAPSVLAVLSPEKAVAEWQARRSSQTPDIH